MTVNDLRAVLDAMIENGHGYLELRDSDNPDFTLARVFANDKAAYVDFSAIKEKCRVYTITDTGIDVVEAYKMMRDREEIDG